MKFAMARDNFDSIGRDAQLIASFIALFPLFGLSLVVELNRGDEMNMTKVIRPTEERVCSFGLANKI